MTTDASSSPNPNLPTSDLVKFKSSGSARIIELSRPKALNSLNLEMVEAITSALKVWKKIVIIVFGQIWQDSDGCSLVIIKSAPFDKRVFCAGGDVVTIAKLRGRPQDQLPFFQHEYALNHLIGTFRKPIVSFIDGITSM